jgi:hypothetical protein
MAFSFRAFPTFSPIKRIYPNIREHSRFFKAGDDTAFDAEDLKEFVPKSLLLGALAFRALPFAGELDGVVTDFVPGNRHGVFLHEKVLWRQ